MDKMIMIYIFISIIMKEMEIHRCLYNIYPMRNNPLISTPNDIPEDNYFLVESTEEFSVIID
jgi:hypothetical protein